MFIRTHNSVIYSLDSFSVFRGDILSKCPKRIELLEKEIINLKGRERLLAKREYFSLLRSNSKICGLEDPIYLRRR